MKWIFILVFALWGCSPQKSNPFDESKYVLVRTDSFNGNIGTEYFVFKSDTSRKRQVNYWGNGKLMSKSFTHNGKMDGEFIMYDYDGKLMVIDSFINGNKVYEKLFQEKDTSVKLFKNGKVQEFNNIDSF